MIQREELNVEGAAGIDRKALRGRIVAIAFIYEDGNVATNATLFEQVYDFRRTLTTVSGSATNTAYSLATQSNDEDGTATGNYEPPGIAGDIVLEVDSGDSNQVTRCVLWIET